MGVSLCSDQKDEATDDHVSRSNDLVDVGVAFLSSLNSHETSLVANDLVDLHLIVGWGVFVEGEFIVLLDGQGLANGLVSILGLVSMHKLVFNRFFMMLFSQFFPSFSDELMKLVFFLNDKVCEIVQLHHFGSLGYFSSQELLELEILPVDLQHVLQLRLLVADVAIIIRGHCWLWL